MYRTDAIGLAMQQDDFLTRGVMSRRVVAWLVDLVLIGMLCMTAWTVGVFFGLITLGLGWSALGLIPALPLLYHWLFLTAMAATPGQALFGLTVRDNDDLSPPSALQALVFTILFYLTFALGWFWMGIALFTIRHRTVHDMVAGLVVVRTRALTPPARFWNMGSGVSPGGPSAA
jgi:uncharacterized RDD family membrane protein YckC